MSISPHNYIGFIYIYFLGNFVMCIYLYREFFGRQLDVVDEVVVLYIFVVIVFDATVLNFV